MGRIPDNIRHVLNTYLRELKNNNIPVQRAILFGSYARGGQQEYSDIDIALVSDIFTGDRIEDKDKIRKVTLSVSSELEVIPFSRKDFQKSNPFVNEIIKTGVILV